MGEPYTGYWESEQHGEWAISYRVVPQEDGQPIVSEVRVYPIDQEVMEGLADPSPGELWRPGVTPVPPGGIPVRGVLRHIKTIAAAERARQRLRSAQQWRPTDPTIAGLGFESLDDPTPRHKGRRDGRPDTYFAELARRYVAALAEPGIAQRASQHLAEEDHVEVSTMYQRLHEARRRGLLTKPTTKGKAGGKLTKYALELLNEDEELT